MPPIPPPSPESHPSGEITRADGVKPYNQYLLPTECWNMPRPYYCGDSRSWIDIVALADGRFSTDGSVYGIQKNEDCYGRPCVYATRTQAIRVAAARAIRFMRAARHWSVMYAAGFERPEYLEYAINWALTTTYREIASPRPPRPVHIPAPPPPAPDPSPESPLSHPVGHSVIIPTTDPWSTL